MQKLLSKKKNSNGDEKSIYELLQDNEKSKICVYIGLSSIKSLEDEESNLIQSTFYNTKGYFGVSVYKRIICE